MKKIILGLLCLFMVSASLFADMTRSELQQMYLTFLRNNGVTASIDSDGDIAFEYEFEYDGDYYKDTYFIIVDENDQQYFSIMYFLGPLNNPSQDLLTYANLAASAATREAYVAKVYVNNGNVFLRAETFLVLPGNFEAVFFKLMNGMGHAITEFLNNMQ